MKKLRVAILWILCIFLCTGIITMITWYRFTPKSIAGSSITTEETDITKVTTSWFDDFFSQYEGPFVPFTYRIKDKKIENISVLDEEQNLIQIDYLIKPVSNNLQFITYYTASPQNDGWYLSQDVLQWEKENNTYTIVSRISPVQYQIQTDESLRTPQIQHYAMADEEETYVFQNEKLYVTYDHGKNLIEVPIAYEDIAGTNNGLYDEQLPEHGYIVQKDFTGFVGYDQNGSYLIYSKDMGNNWQTQRLFPVNYRSENIYFNKTETKYYLTLALDRSLGNDYYATYVSNNLKDWISIKNTELNNLTPVSFISDGVGYFQVGTSENGDILVYYTQDEGNSYQTITIPAHETTFLGNTIKPFKEMEYVYKDNNKIYMVVSQGEFGDYAKDNSLVKGLYESSDGINFTFVEEFTEPVTLAG